MEKSGVLDSLAQTMSPHQEMTTRSRLGTSTPGNAKPQEQFPLNPERPQEVLLDLLLSYQTHSAPELLLLTQLTDTLLLDTMTVP